MRKLNKIFEMYSEFKRILWETQSRMHSMRFCNVQSNLSTPPPREILENSLQISNIFFIFLLNYSI